ncbi:hypothetical protein SOVF_047000 [Spinacia oleracea]|nr:hypothetical protein SOVF_047000 [Spinacia oleracea]
MEEDRNNHNNNSRRLEEKDEEDRLSSLPDVIINDILSLLPIKSAAATSVLSHRWRHLWTGVTRFEFESRTWPESASLFRILCRLTYRDKLRTFTLILDDSSAISWGDLKRSFSVVCRQNVEEIKVISNTPLPRCVFKCESLVVLDLGSVLHCRLLKADKIRLPNLNKLRLCLPDESVPVIPAVFISSPLLQDLCLEFHSLKQKHVVNISSPNLKSLDIQMVCPHQHSAFLINTPNLTNIKIRDSSSFYVFVQNPAQLLTAYIDFMYGKHESWDEDLMSAADYFDENAKFVQGMSSARKLHLQSDIQIFAHLNPPENGMIPTLHNLTYFKTTLVNVFNGWDALLFYLQGVPNLNDLEVSLGHNPAMDHHYWCAPDCLVSKVKTITVRAFEGNDDELKLLEYILKNAFVLEELRTHVRIKDDNIEARQGKEYKFCEAMFKLPRSSLTSEVVFSGQYINASSNSL